MVVGLGWLANQVVRPVARAVGEGVGEIVSDVFDLDDDDREGLKNFLGGTAAFVAGVATSVALADAAGVIDVAASAGDLFDLANSVDPGTVASLPTHSGDIYFGASDNLVDSSSHSAGSAPEVRFGYRWEGGEDQWGNPVGQSPGSPPEVIATGQPVNPVDVTWH